MPAPIIVPAPIVRYASVAVALVGDGEEDRPAIEIYGDQGDPIHFAQSLVGDDDEDGQELEELHWLAEQIQFRLKNHRAR